MNLTALKWTIEVVSLLAALASALEAAPLKAVITLSASATAGDEITIDGSKSTGEILRYNWSITGGKEGRDMLKETDDKARPQLRSYVGVYTVTLKLTDKEGYIEESTAKITITADATVCPECKPCQPGPPTPEPQPTPIPPAPPLPTPPMPPAPTIPIGEFNVAPKIAAYIQAMADPNKVANAEKVRVGLESISQQIKDGKITGLSGLTKAIGALLSSTNNQQWKDSSVPIQNILIATYEAHKAGPLALDKQLLDWVIKNPQGYATLLHEAAVGVDFGAKSK